MTDGQIDVIVAEVVRETLPGAAFTPHGVMSRALVRAGIAAERARLMPIIYNLIADADDPAHDAALDALAARAALKE